MTDIRGIGLPGAAGAGKTTFARALQKEFMQEGHLALIVSFATMLKVEVARLFKLPEEIIAPDFDKTTPIEFVGGYENVCWSRYGEIPRTVRELFQFHGSYRRRHNPEYWTDAVVRTLTGLMAGNTSQFRQVCIIFDDVRYQNEIDCIRRNFGADAAIYELRRKAERVAPAHESETQKLTVDAIFDLDKDEMSILPTCVLYRNFDDKYTKGAVRAPGS